MVIKNPWVGYLTRSYNQVKTSILNKLRVNAPEITEYSESNILIVIVGIFSGIAEMLNYYIDNMAREAFLSTARKFDSVIKITQLINYRIKSNISASVDITFEALDADGNPVTMPSDFEIPAGTELSSTAGVSFLTSKPGVIGKGLSKVSIPVRQQAIVALSNVGLSEGSSHQIFLLPSDYDDGTIYVEVDSEPWSYKEHLGFSTPSSKHYTVERNVEGVFYVLFGDDVNGKIPDAGSVIATSYRITLGSRGNLPENTITQLISTLTWPVTTPAITEISVTNLLRSTGGLPSEDIDRIRRSAPLSLRTLDRAVTFQDYEDVTRLAPSVDKAGVKFSCGKQVHLYITPIGGGIASSQILSDTESFVKSRGIIGLDVQAHAAGETYIGLKMVVYAKFRVNTNLAYDDIKSALIDKYSADNSNINLPIRISDIIAIVDNQEKVDYIQSTNLYAVPYARPINSIRELNWTCIPGDSATSVSNWSILYTGGAFKLLKGDVITQTISLNTPYSNGVFTITINSAPSGVTEGDRWKFTIYPINRDIVLDDYTMPRIHPDFNFVDITVNEQL